MVRRGSPRDLTAANWKRTLKRVRRNLAEARELGCTVIEPADFEVAPSLRKPAPGIATIFRAPPS